MNTLIVQAARFLALVTVCSLSCVYATGNDKMMLMSSANAKKLGAAIKRHRKAKGLSQYSLAAAVDMPRSTILRMERGEFAAPSPEKLQRIANTLDVEFEELFELAGYATPGLPEVPVYLRRKFDDLSDEDLAKVERYIERIRKQEGGGDARRDR
jgi:transcriptional regulator with XRE-family HTH domain